MELSREQVELELMKLLNGVGVGGNILAHDQAIRDTITAQGERIDKLEEALRLNLAVAPDDPILLTPVEREVVVGRERIQQQAATIKGLEEQLRQANSQEESAKDMPYEGSPLENIRLKQALAEAQAELEKYRVNAEKYVTPRVWKSDHIEMEGWIISHEEATGIRTAMKALAEAQEMVNAQKMYLQSKDNEITRLGNASATLQAEKRDLNTAIDQLQLTIKRLADSLARVTEERDGYKGMCAEKQSLYEKALTVGQQEHERFLIEMTAMRQRLATLTAALKDGIPRYIELFEQCGLGDGATSVWVQQAQSSLARPDAGPGVKGDV